MANRFEVRVPNLYEALLAGERSYDDARKARAADELSTARREAASLYGSNPQSAIARLLAGGDMQGAQAISSMQNATADRDWRRQEADRSQRNADRAYGLQERALTQRAPTELERRATAAGLQPGSQEYKDFMLRGGRNADAPISAGDKKAIFAAEDELPGIEGTIVALKRAKDLNSKTFSGATAGARAWAGSNLPDWMVPDAVADKATADNTTEWSKIMAPEALKTMADTLKGATTDFELRKFIDMLGDPQTPPQIRSSIIDRMITLSERKKGIAEARMRDLRGGTYFKPQGGAPAGGSITKEQYDALPSGTPFTAPDGSQRIKP